MVDLRELLAAAINSPNDYDHADAILATLDAAGLVVVPRDPTGNMSEAGWRSLPCNVTKRFIADECYRAMISASPHAQKGSDHD